MSTISVDNIEDRSASETTGTEHVIHGTVKAWAYHNASGTLTSSHNISSVTDNGTGSWSPNITNAMADADYFGVVNGQINSGDGIAGVTNCVLNGTASQWTVDSENGASDQTDRDTVQTGVIGATA